METAPTWERENFTANRSACCLEPELGTVQIFRVEDDQWPARSHRFSCSESTSHTTVAELTISRAVVDETPVEYAPVKGLASSYVDDIELDVVDDESPVLPEHCVPQDRSQRP